MDAQVDNSIKKQRSAELRNIAEQQKLETLKAQIGTTANVLWEGKNTNENDSQVFGYTENYTRVCSQANRAPEAGGVAPCKLVSVEPNGRFALADIIP